MEIVLNSAWRKGLAIGAGTALCLIYVLLAARLFAASLFSEKPELASLQRAVRLDPSFAEALQAVAKARMDAKQYGEGIALLERVVKLQPGNESAHYGLMMAYRNAGRMADAAAQQAELDKMRQAPEGEFTDFLKRLGDKAPAQ